MSEPIKSKCRRNPYIKTEAGWRRNLREIERLRRSDRGSGATAAAITRRETASRQWVTGETTR